MTQLTDNDLFELAAPLRQVEAVTRPADAPRRSARIPEIVRLAGVAVGIFLLVAVVMLVAQHDRQAKPANPPKPAPPPCVVGTPGCGPLPVLPTPHTPMPKDVHIRGVPRPGRLRAGTYEFLDFSGLNSHVIFTVPAGWRWNGYALSKGNAAIYFATGQVLVYQNPCRWDRPQHPSIDWKIAGMMDTAAAFAAQPMRYATQPRMAYGALAGDNVEGRSTTWEAVELRLTVPSNLDFSRCDHGQYRSWQTTRRIRSQQGPGQRDLIVIARRFDKQLLIDAATFPDTPTRLVHQVDSILASLQIGQWG